MRMATQRKANPAAVPAFAPILLALSLFFTLLSIAYQRLRPGVSGPASPPQWTPLDAATAANASIFSAEDFLSAEEVAHVLRLVENQPTEGRAIENTCHSSISRVRIPGAHCVVVLCLL